MRGEKTLISNLQNNSLIPIWTLLVILDFQQPRLKHHPPLIQKRLVFLRGDIGDRSAETVVDGDGAADVFVADEAVGEAGVWLSLLLFVVCFVFEEWWGSVGLVWWNNWYGWSPILWCPLLTSRILVIGTSSLTFPNLYLPPSYQPQPYLNERWVSLKPYRKL